MREIDKLKKEMTDLLDIKEEVAQEFCNFLVTVFTDVNLEDPHIKEKIKTIAVKNKVPEKELFNQIKAIKEQSLH